jgi:hypothetical protein
MDGATQLLDLLTVHMRHDLRSQGDVNACSNVLRQTVLTALANLSGALPYNVVYEVLDYHL